ncbi:MAG TPA: phage tail sheath subtilisin-like domain-containing protein [Roseateles sp.]
MPEYLAPGVYVEETSFRAKSIEGVPTSTTGFVGLTRYGPVQYPNGPRSSAPRLVTSFTEFERIYGGLEPLELDGGEHLPYLSHAARAFFNNGGKRLYVSRVYHPRQVAGVDVWGVARLDVPVGADAAAWVARWPGDDGEVMVETKAARSRNIGFTFPLVAGDPLHRNTWGAQAKGVRAGALIETWPAGTTVLPGPNATLDATRLFVVDVDADGRQTFIGQAGGPGVSLPDNTVLLLVELQVTVRHGNPAAPSRVDVYDALAASGKQTRYIGTVLDRDDPQDENATVYLAWTEVADPFGPARLAIALQSPPGVRLQNGNDGLLLTPSDIEGKPADPDHAEVKATGLEALAEIDDIAIVAAPDAGSLATAFEASSAVVAHAEICRYRIAVIDGPPNASMNTIRAYRGKFDSKYAALYHPWIEVLDPLAASAPGVPQPLIALPPSGFVCGIYARSDIERGVHKAPANEVVRGLSGFEININKGRQDVLNPEGVNCLRFFEGRGNRVWGARTISSDPEWKYVNVRRLFIYLEHSIDKASQWAVFEPNGEKLWANVRRTVEDFLFVLWRDGALLGAKPEEAYFVRCDRTTMTQNDLDNGRMICLIGVAPVRPAEFVIFRVGQWTSDAAK